MKKYDVKKSEDGDCPYCHSNFVVKRSKLGSAPSSTTVAPEPNMKVWKCYRCNKDFFYQE